VNFPGLLLIETMSHLKRRSESNDAAQLLIEEMLRSGLALTSMLASLLEDIPDNAFPGEENGAVLIEMVVGSCRPVVDTVGESECRAAAALLEAVRSKVVDDLRAAALLARPSK
jgi:hypothetical protein